MMNIRFRPLTVYDKARPRNASDTIRNQGRGYSDLDMTSNTSPA